MRAAVIATWLALAASAAWPATSQPKARLIRWPAGAQGTASAAVAGAVQGYRGQDFMVEGRAGQVLEVRLQSRHPGLAFNVLAEGAREAMFIGRSAGIDARLTLPDDGRYRIQTYLPRSAARRGERGAFELRLSRSGAALAPLPASRDAKVAGTAFHATTQVTCRWAYAPAAGLCDAGVVRRGHDGTGTVVVRGSGGQRRVLLFVQGRLAATDTARTPQAAGQGESITVQFDDGERHEIPQPLLRGG
jgi:hypothetical protein